MGQDLCKLAGRGMNVTGIDLAPSVAQLAQLHFEAYDLQGEAMQGNAEALQFGDGSFDVVYSCGVLGHTPNTQQAINEIHRVARDGGLAVVVLYYRYSWFNLISKLGKTNIEFEDEDPPKVSIYSRRELRDLFSRFKEAEFSLEYCYPSPTPRKGALAAFYNNIFVPGARLVPYFIMKNFGWHAVVKAQK